MIYRRRGGGINRPMDWVTLSLYIGLVFVGWCMIYAVSFDEVKELGLLSSPAGKQLIWIAISFSIFALLQVFDWKFWQVFAYPIYAAFLLLLLLVLAFGVTIKGATSWYSIGGFTLQPSEFAKFGTALALSAYLSTYKINLRLLEHQAVAIAIFAVPAGIILLQPDAGSALVFASFFIVLYREGLNPIYYITTFFLAALLISGLLFSPIYILATLFVAGIFVFSWHQPQPLYWFIGAGILATGALYLLQTGEYVTETLWVLASALLIYAFNLWQNKRRQWIMPIGLAMSVGFGCAYIANHVLNNVMQSHQRDRIWAWLAPQKADPQGAYYNIIQSKLAISSGGWTGRGYLQGKMTSLNYVPEQVTDFIFCTIGEEQGFTGVFALITLFLILLFRLIRIAERQRSNFARIYAYGLFGIMFIHFFINIGMTMGLIPVIGIPLPFISKGGSSLLGFTIMLSVLLKMDSNRFQV